MNGEIRPLIAQVPFVLSPDADFADLHLVRSNPIARCCKKPLPAMLAVHGPDSYISPDWYQTPDQVPTWNYVSVHLIGTLEPLPMDKLTDVLSRLTQQFEAQLAPKPIWTHEKMSAGVFEKMQKMIVPFRLHIEDVESTWKLNQNKSDDARTCAADAVESSGIGTNTEDLARIMRSLPE